MLIGVGVGVIVGATVAVGSTVIVAVGRGVAVCGAQDTRKVIKMKTLISILFFIFHSRIRVNAQTWIEWQYNRLDVVDSLYPEARSVFRPNLHLRWFPM